MVQTASETIDGQVFNGMRYWFEYESDTIEIHRIIDRQTWEVGGNLDDVNLCLRNWLTAPRLKIEKETHYSTAGLEHLVGCMPGNMWARWSLLPAFDMQYGKAGVLLAWFDRMSLIRTVIETQPGENSLRCVDMHLFEKAKRCSTNPKTVVFAPNQIDHIDALNLWTRLHDRERDRARAQIGMKDEAPPLVCMSQNVWLYVRFDKTYEGLLETAHAIGADLVFIDPVWENMQSFNEALEQAVPEDKRKNSILDKYFKSNQCATLDFNVAETMGGEAGLKALCDRAASKGIKVLSWMATHVTPVSYLRDGRNRAALGHGTADIFAVKESGYHPDTGYPGDCWPVNLNAPIGEYIKEKILSACKRTGLAGFLWDSFSNLGWWHVDYSDKSMRPQFDKMAGLYRDLANEGLYLMPEAITAFSSHSCLGLFGGDVYSEEILGYSYETVIAYHANPGEEPYDTMVLKGLADIHKFFMGIAHKRVPNLHFVPLEKCNPKAVAEVREFFAMYKKVRNLMKRRTVLKNNEGVQWDNEGEESVLFTFKDLNREGSFTDALTGEKTTGSLQKHRVYTFDKARQPASVLC